ncbi:DUF6545 domain-containing protein [Cryobacterium levicorallinum]|uniref:DUF6545 domain-containing protein n=1 Tax=Cryobacterium levicorallinum TaxID=995038 RepID=A0ABY1ECH0_9MICO|nr:DUF6545 domain-containing protein [Cryobacterium levicorallinum]GEP26444.1 hypothetical protein CLE01_10420 [Cryobacterium levicorallinum]SFH43248.1 hypothetical protein SAMN05216274_10574 [Cryobacterium levicorallinum]
MIAVLVSALMWLLVASLLILRRGRAERNISYAALTIAIAMTLNTDQVYWALDPLAGGSNLVTLVADATLMVGVFFLGRGVMRASEHQTWAVRLALGRFTLVAALIGAIGTFLLIHRGGTTTSFMLELGEQPAAAAYSMIQFIYYGIVLAAMAALAGRQLRSSEGAQRLPPVSLILGSTFGVALSVVVIIMDLAHVVGELDLMAAVAVAYEPLHILTFLLLCLGFASQPAARTFQARSRERTTRRLVGELEPIWAKATTVRPGISQNEHVAFDAGGPETLLHRQVVEIRDAMIDTRVSFDVSDYDKELVERAERHLLGAGPTGSVPTVSPATTGDGLRQR